MLLNIGQDEMKRPADAYWYDLKDSMKVRAHKKAFGKCEYCWLRPYRALHHRTYEREGQELPGDVMLVCDTCHDLIHGYIGSWPGSGSEISVRAGSLAHQGDSGKDLFVKTPQWIEYLK